MRTLCARLWWWLCDWHMIAKHFEWVFNGLLYWQYLQDSNPNFRQKIISKILRTITSNLIAASGDITGSRHRANCQLLQNGDLACLDFVVNRTVCSVISRFYSSLESSCGYIIASWLAYPTGISGISSFPRIGQSAVFLFPMKEAKQIDRFEKKKAAH